MNNRELPELSPSETSEHSRTSISRRSHKSRHSKRSFTPQSQSSRTSLSKSTLSHSRRNFSTADISAQVLISVKDEHGRDVTPKPLVTLKPSVLQQHTLLASSADASPSSAESFDDFDRQSILSFSKSIMDWGSRGTSQSSGTSTPGTSESMLEISVQSIPSSVTASPRGTKEANGNGLESVSDAKRPPSSPHIEMIDERIQSINDTEPEKQVILTLEETPTIWLLDIQGSTVEKDSNYGAFVSSKNEAYKQLLHAKKMSRDNYIDQSIQTFNSALKAKETQTYTPKKKEIAVSASEWDIYDSYNSPFTKNKIVNEGKDLPDKDSEANDQKPGFSGQEDKMLQLLQISEASISQNIYHKKHLLFRGIPNGTEIPTKEDDKTIPMLWKYSYSGNNTNKSVTCMSWNSKNQDILAVGYGDLDYQRNISTKNAGGFALCWSVKNPKFPARIIQTSSSVTALSFSKIHPNLLAVATYDGVIAIYDTKGNLASSPIIKAPILDSNQTEEHGANVSQIKHKDPVWDLEWVDRGDERGECLVSISTDGLVIQWTVKKKFEATELMKLKKLAVNNNNSSSGKTPKKTEPSIARLAGGLCLQFSKLDSSIYLVGTEEGHIHKCSSSYNEQYLESFSLPFGHGSSVYKIRWSPFSHQVFLSCSADWTIKIWDTERSDSPPITLQSSMSSINDVAWSPGVATILAAVTASKELQIWDLQVSLLDPILNVPLSFEPSTVVFAEQNSAVVVGDKNGNVSFFYLPNERQRAENGGDALVHIIASATK